MKKAFIFLSALYLAHNLALAGVSQPIIKGIVISINKQDESIIVKSGDTQFILKNAYFHKEFSDIGCQDEFIISKETLIKKEKYKSAKDIVFKCNK